MESEQKNQEEQSSDNASTPNAEVYKRDDNDNGYTRNSTEIALLKACRKYDVVANHLLGTYNEQGEYSISTKILEELLSLKKVIEKVVDDEIFVKAQYKDGITFHFVLKTVVKDQELGTTTSVLYLNEPILKVNGYIQETLSTAVGTYTFKTDEFYSTNCQKAFHIVEKETDDDEGALKTPAKFIDARYNYISEVMKASANKYKELEENYFNTRLQILNEIPQGAIILSEFNKKRSKLEKFFLLNKNKYRALNELLTAILEANPNILAQMPAYNILMGSLNNKYLASVKEISAFLGLSEPVKTARQIEEDLIAGRGIFIQEELLATGKGKLSVGGPKKKSAAKSKSKGGGGGGGGKGGKGGGKKGGGKKDKKDEKKKPLGSPQKFTPTPELPQKNYEGEKVKAKYFELHKDSRTKDKSSDLNGTEHDKSFI